MSTKQKTQMKRTESRLIRLPALQVETPGLGRGLVQEINVRLYEYSRRTAKPTLSDNVIKPFDTAFKKKVFEKAKEEVGVDPEGIIREKFSYAETVGGKRLLCTVAPSTRSSHETVLSLIDIILSNIQSDNLKGIRQDGVRKEDDGVYVLAGFIMDELERLNGVHSSRLTKQDLSLRDLEGKFFPWDSGISEMRVYLDLQRYAGTSPENVDSFHSARSLSRRISRFMSELEQSLMDQFGISPGGCEKTSFDFELSDGSGVRYLFAPRHSTEYSKVYSRLVGQGTKSITASTGDLNIMQELAFKDQYESVRNGSGVVVSTEAGKSGKRGIVKILRTSAGDKQEQVYRVVDNEGKVYVRVQDVIDTIEMLARLHTTESTHLQIGFFAAYPELGWFRPDPSR